MAKVTGGIASMLSGKAEGMVFVQFNGGTYTRRIPRRKKDSSTPRMLLNQKRFKEVNNFCAQFKESVIPMIWNGAAEKMSGYALFLKSNMPAFAPDGSLIDPKLLRLSTGKLKFPQGMIAGKPELESSFIEVSWEYDIHTGGEQLKDELMVISAGEGNYSEIMGTGIVRKALNGSFELPDLPTAARHIYLFFASKDRRGYSESVCFEI